MDRGALPPIEIPIGDGVTLRGPADLVHDALADAASVEAELAAALASMPLIPEAPREATSAGSAGDHPGGPHPDDGVIGVTSGPLQALFAGLWGAHPPGRSHGVEERPRAPLGAAESAGAGLLAPGRACWDRVTGAGPWVALEPLALWVPVLLPPVPGEDPAYREVAVPGWIVQVEPGRFAAFPDAALGRLTQAAATPARSSTKVGPGLRLALALGGLVLPWVVAAAAVGLLVWGGT